MDKVLLQMYNSIHGGPLVSVLTPSLYRLFPLVPPLFDTLLSTTSPNYKPFPYRVGTECDLGVFIVREEPLTPPGSSLYINPPKRNRVQFYSHT